MRERGGINWQIEKGKNERKGGLLFDKLRGERRVRERDIDKGKKDEKKGKDAREGVDYFTFREGG